MRGGTAAPCPGRRRHGAALAAALLLAIPAAAGAQPLPPSARPVAATLPLPLAAHAGARTPAQAFAIEAAGGVGGSLLGFTIVLLAEDDDCSVEDLGCHLENAFLGIALATAGSAAGAYVVGRALDTRPSGVGTTLGALAGAGAGIGMWHLFTEELDLVNRTEAAVVVYALTQGIMAALGSRLVRSLQ